MYMYIRNAPSSESLQPVEGTYICEVARSEGHPVKVLELTTSLVSALIKTQKTTG